MFIKMKTPEKDRSTAQAMVEFALVLPILLTLVYGVLEAGRLLFIFASVNTASRQAVRYGSAIGLVDTNNDGTIDTPRYEDCVGITAAANNVAFLAPFTNINISYDRGLDGSGNVVAISGINPDPSFGDVCTSTASGTIQNGDRVNVYVSAQFSPIISFVHLNPLTIESSASRTIVGEISIQVTAVPGSWPGAGSSENAIVLSLSPESGTFAGIGETINFQYIIFNSGSKTLAAPFTLTVSSPSGGISHNCGNLNGTLAPGGSITCNGSYVTTLADVNTGQVIHTATVTSGVTTSNEVTGIYTSEAVLSLDLNLTKVTPTEAFTEGIIINYSFALTNTGNVSLKGPFNITDNDILGIFVCSNLALAPGETATCVAQHAITVSDINAGSITNNAYARDADSNTVSNVVSATVVTKVLQMTVEMPTLTVPVRPNDIIEIKYSLRNWDPSSPITTPTILGTNIGNITCPDSIPAGSAITCTGQYTVTKAAIEAATSPINIATASGVLNAQNTFSAEITTQFPPLAAPLLEIVSITPMPTPAAPSDATGMVYEYVVKNSGNTTLNNVQIVDSTLGITATCLSTTLAPTVPATTTICTSSPYAVTDTDRANGSITSSVQATANSGDGAVLVTSGLKEVIAITHSGSRVAFTLTADPITILASSPIRFTFKVKNTGGTILTDYTFLRDAGPILDVSACNNPITPIGIGKEITCTPPDIIISQTTTATWRVNTPETGDVGAPPVTIKLTGICTITSKTFISGKEVQIKLANSSIINASVSQIKVTWNVDGGTQTLNSASLVDTSSSSLIWGPAAIATSPYTISSFNVGSNRIIPNASTKTLILSFKSPYKVSANDEIVVSFAESECAPITIKP